MQLKSPSYPSLSSMRTDNSTTKTAPVVGTMQRCRIHADQCAPNPHDQIKQVAKMYPLTGAPFAVPMHEENTVQRRPTLVPRFWTLYIPLEAMLSTMVHNPSIFPFFTYND